MEALGPLFILWVGGSALVGLIGKNRDIGFLPVFIISLIVSPILGVIVALCSKKKYSLQRLVENQDALFKQQYLRTNTFSDRAKHPSIADELLKLKQLLDNEAITPAEYESQKRKLLQQ